MPERATSAAPTDARRPAGGGSRVGRRSAGDPRRRSAAREAGQARRAQRLVRRPRLRGAHEGLGRPAERAGRRPLPVRHPRGPSTAGAGLGGRPRRQRDRDPPPPAAAPVPARVPGDRVDPAARGRASVAVVAARVLPAQPDDQARGPRQAAGRGGPAGLPRGRPAGQPGALAGGRLVRAGRRAQAIARPGRHGADRGRLERLLRAAGARGPVHRDLVDRRSRRVAPRGQPPAGPTWSWSRPPPRCCRPTRAPRMAACGSG